MAQTVRVSEISRLQSQRSSVSVHFLDEVFHRLVRRDAPLLSRCPRVLGLGALRSGLSVAGSGSIRVVTTVLSRSAGCLVVLVSGGDLIKVLTKVLGQADSGIVATRQHESVKQVPDGEDVASFEFGGGAADSSCAFANLQ